MHVLHPLYWHCSQFSGKHVKVIIKCNAIRGSNVYGGETWNAEFSHNLILIWLINNIYMVKHRQRCVAFKRIDYLPGSKYYYVRIPHNGHTQQKITNEMRSSLFLPSSISRACLNNFDDKLPNSESDHFSRNSPIRSFIFATGSIYLDLWGIATRER